MTKAITLGIQDAIDGKEPRLNETQVQSVLQALQQRADERQKVAADKNKTEGTAYLAENAKKGVTVTESGLQYKVLTQGEGDKPTAEDQVTVHYRGTLIDGTEFDRLNCTWSACNVSCFWCDSWLGKLCN